jgi:hypothetical protein
MASLNKEIDNHINCLKNSTDKEAYITMHDLRFFIANQRDSVERYQGKKTMLIEDFLDQYANQEFEDRQACVEQMQAMLNDKLGPCETNLNLLDRELNAKEEKPFLGLDSQALLIIGVCIGILLFILLIVAISRSGKKKERVPVSYHNPGNSSNGNNGRGQTRKGRTHVYFRIFGLVQRLDTLYHRYSGCAGRVVRFEDEIPVGTRQLFVTTEGIPVRKEGTKRPRMSRDVCLNEKEGREEIRGSEKEIRLERRHHLRS